MMSDFQVCDDLDDFIELAPQLGFYLQPIIKISILVHFPPDQFERKPIFSNYELLDHLRTLIKPKNFATIKISKITLQFIEIDAELHHKSDLFFVLTRFNKKNIYLPKFPYVHRISASEVKSIEEHPIKIGISDSIHIKHLPLLWFTKNEDRFKEIWNPSEELLTEVFQTFGEIHSVYLPISNSFPNENTSKKFSVKENTYFEAFIQFKEYKCFVKALDTLRGMKLVHKDKDKYYCCHIQIVLGKIKQNEEFNKKIIKLKTPNESEDLKKTLKKPFHEGINKNQSPTMMDEKLIKLDRRKKREEKRKLREIQKLKEKESEQINIKIKTEEKKLLRAQRNLQSLRLLDELLERIKNLKLEQLKGDVEEKINQSNELLNKSKSSNNSNLEDIERELRSRLINKFTNNNNNSNKNIPKQDNNISKTKQRGSPRYHRSLYKNNREDHGLLRNIRYNQRPSPNFYFKNKIRKQHFDYSRKYQKINYRYSHYHHVYHYPQRKLQSDFMDIHNIYLRYFKKISYGSSSITSEKNSNSSKSLTSTKTKCN